MKNVLLEERYSDAEKLEMLHRDAVSIYNEFGAFLNLDPFPPSCPLDRSKRAS